jgi:putative ABC transport system permease protein
VLGAFAARHLGIDHVTDGLAVWLGGRWFAVVGILNPVTLAPEIDSAALVGWQVSASLFGFDGHPGTEYVRTDPSAVVQVEALLAGAANPADPEQVQVSRPSDALAARAVANSAFTTLLLGLGSVALLVGAIGVANVMIIAVLERRSEVGLRRALGATRSLIGAQFVIEAAVLSLAGGAAGCALGALATAVYAVRQDWLIDVPPAALAGGLGGAVVIGVVSGAYPALRAARLAPTEALRSS